MRQATLIAIPGSDEKPQASDETLVSAIANGDKRAFETLYRRYYKRVSQFVFRLTPDRALGEEIVDDTLLAVWKSAAKFAGRSRVSTWIFGIAYRRTMKSLDREKKHRAEVHDELVLGFQPDTDATRDPLAMTAANELQRDVGIFLKKLDPDQQVALQLTAMGHSYPEISVIVDCPANTVKTRVFKARHKLKDYLAGAGMKI